MQNQLKIALIQSDLVWEQPNKNRQQFIEKIQSLASDIDLVVLPEMFTSGFTMHPEKIAETMDGETISSLRDLAKEKQCAITGSLVILEHGNYYNRLIFIDSEGNLDTYDKRHTFTLAGEHKAYSSGKTKTIINYRGWKICPLICYDLRFPVWSRNVEDYDLLLYVANWPKPRINAWDALLKARAIENMCYCVGVNRVGLDANQHEYSGHSAVYNVLGKQILKLPEHKEGIKTTVLESSHIRQYREKLNFLNDRDRFLIT